MDEHQRKNVKRIDYRVELLPLVLHCCHPSAVNQIENGRGNRSGQQTGGRVHKSAGNGSSAKHNKFQTQNTKKI
jgi:hypothetical protein